MSSAEPLPLTEREGAWQARELPAALRSEFGHHFMLALPQGYAAAPGADWPLVLFLHGRGEWGDDLSRVCTQGVGALIEQGGSLPAIVVAPQSPEHQMWHPDFIDKVLQCVAASCRVDLRRVYLTGLSMGAMGSLAMIAAFPRRFAALAPLAGAFPNDAMSLLYQQPLGETGAWGHALGALHDLPVWIAHGDADEVVPIVCSQRIAAVMQTLGARLRTDWLAGVGHDSWTPIYRDTPTFWPWLFAQSRMAPGVPVDVAPAAPWAGHYLGAGGVSAEVGAEGERLRVRWRPAGIEDVLLPGEAGCYAGTVLVRFTHGPAGPQLELPGMGVLRRSSA